MLKIKRNKRPKQHSHVNIAAVLKQCDQSLSSTCSDFEYTRSDVCNVKGVYCEKHKSLYIHCTDNRMHFYSMQSFNVN